MVLRKVKGVVLRYVSDSPRSIGPFYGLVGASGEGSGVSRSSAVQALRSMERKVGSDIRATGSEVAWRTSVRWSGRAKHL